MRTIPLKPIIIFVCSVVCALYLWTQPHPATARNPNHPSPATPMNTTSQPMLGDHRDGVVSVAFSPDGRLATGETDGMARIWDAQGRLMMTLKASDHGGEPVDPNRDQFPGYIWDVVFSPDGTKLGTRDHHGTIRVWDSQGTLLIEAQGASHRFPSKYVVFSPNSDLVAVVVNDQEYVKLWTIQTQQWVELRNSQGDKTFGTEFSPDGSRLATYGDYSVRLWDSQGRLLADPEEINVTRGKPLRDSTTGWAGAFSIVAVAFRPDGSMFIVQDYALDAHGQVIGRLEQPKEWGYPPLYYSYPKFSSDGRKLITLSAWTSIGYVWNSHGKLLLKPFGVHGTYVAGIFSPDSSRLATSATLQEGDPLKLWDSQGEDLVLIANLEGHQDNVSVMTFSPDSRLLATSDNNAIRLWSRQGQLLRAFPKQHEKPVVTLQFSPDGRRLVSHSIDDYALRFILKIWSIQL